MQLAVAIDMHAKCSCRLQARQELGATYMGQHTDTTQCSSHKQEVVLRTVGVTEAVLWSVCTLRALAELDELYVALCVAATNVWLAA